VPEQIPDRLKIDALGEQERGARVAKIMKTDALDACSLDKSIKRPVDVAWFDWRALPRGEHKI
jgi:hypothetical protein